MTDPTIPLEADPLAGVLPLHEEEIAPTPTDGPVGWSHRKLYDQVVKTIYALPEEFSSPLLIRDFRATDIFALNTALGASIEDSVVVALNKLRDIWDPAGTYALYRFERQSQAFPDVRLVSDDTSLESPLMGIELKGWFAVAKENMPTFRYTVNADACAPQDLLVVFPWVLSDVVAGNPKLLRPFVGEAKYAALYRNYHWRTMRTRAGKNAVITPATHREPYPSSKIDQCSDRPADDGGGNFGRIARSGLVELNSFIENTGKLVVGGVPVRAWTAFFTCISDGDGDARAITSVVERAMSSHAIDPASDRSILIAAMELVLESLRNAPTAVVSPPARRRPRADDPALPD